MHLSSRLLTSMSRQVSYSISKQGLVGYPGITAASKKRVEELLKRDVDENHCFFTQSGLHNHLSHHLLAAYDLGATPAQLQKMFDRDVKHQRPIILSQEDEQVVVNEANWAEHLGSGHNHYNALLSFFKDQIAEHGIADTLEKYLFDENANKDGRNMIIRFCSGAVHPLIQTGYGLEFGLESLVATGLAQACTKTPLQGTEIDLNPGVPQENISLLELLRRVQESEILTPPPYNPGTLINQRFKEALDKGGFEELQKLCSLYHVSDSISDEEIDKKIDEITWVVTLLLIGTGKEGRKPRLDFFLMHFVTSALFIRPIFNFAKKQEHKAAFIRAYVFFMMVFTLIRGRPKINGALAMSYPAVVRAPAPPDNKQITPDSESIGSPFEDEYFNAWPELIQGALYHPEYHVSKAVRSLVYFAKQLGTTAPGGVPGAWRDADRQVETHPGIGLVDGTIFIRTAGVILNTLGWIGHGQQKGQWDYSALGWEEAWQNDD